MSWVRNGSNAHRSSLLSGKRRQGEHDIFLYSLNKSDFFLAKSLGGKLIKK